MEKIFPYTPRKAKFEVLEAVFVARRELLEELKTSIREQADADTLQHWMIIGLRGMGKSHLITMVYHIVKRDPLLNSQWLPVLMNEEEPGVFSLPTLFTRVLTKLADELDKSSKEEAGKICSFLDGLRRGKDSPDKILEDAVDFLKDFVGKSNKRILLLLENADDLFTKCMPKINEVKRLRKILQHDTDMLVVATSPTFFEGIRLRKGVFYDFFRIRRLDYLTYEQAISLLTKWAEIAGDDIGGEFRADDYRLRVLYHLTGGNPRILLFLYLAISGKKKLESSVSTFQVLLEQDLSNYYLSRLRDIPNQEQPIVTALAEASHNLTQKEIAERTFLPLRSIGTFMVRLENAGVVKPVTDKKGKNTYYTLADHMFRLWYQWRTNLREKEVIEALVEFLSVWHKKSDLEMLMSFGGTAADYAREALKFRGTDRFNDYWEIFGADAKLLYMEHLAERNFAAAMDMAENIIDYMGNAPQDIENNLLQAISSIENVEDAQKCLEALNTHDSLIKTTFFIKLAEKFITNDRDDKAEETLNKIIELDPKNAEAWHNLGVARGKQANHAGAEEAFNKVIKLDPKDAVAWYNLGLARISRGNYVGAEEAFNMAIELNPKDAKVWHILGAARGKGGNSAGAEKAFNKAIELNPHDSLAWRILGVDRGRGGNYAGAEEAFNKAIKLNPRDALAWRNLGRARGDQGNYAGAEEALNKAIQLNPRDALTWRMLGLARDEQDNYSGAEEALNKAIELDPQDAITWHLLSVFYFNNYHFDKCIEYSRQGLRHAEFRYRLFCMLSGMDIRIKEVPDILTLFEQYLHADDTLPVQKAHLNFYRAFIFLHRRDFSFFKADLQAGLELMPAFTEDERQNIQGGLLDFLVGVSCGDNQDEMSTYIEYIRKIDPGVADIFSPLTYVIEYIKAVLNQNLNDKRDKRKTTNSAETVLERVPTELREPVESMINIIKKNHEWWAKRPKNIE